MIQVNTKNIVIAVAVNSAIWMITDHYSVIFGLIAVGLSIFLTVKLFVKRGYVPRRDRPTLVHRSMTPAEFEHAVAERMRLDGWDAEVVGGSGDGGVDVRALSPNGDLAIVQCKYYGPNSMVTPAQVRELAGARAISGASIASLVTTGELTTQAKEEASAAGIEVISGETLKSWFNNLPMSA